MLRAALGPSKKPPHSHQPKARTIPSEGRFLACLAEPDCLAVWQEQDQTAVAGIQVDACSRVAKSQQSIKTGC